MNTTPYGYETGDESGIAFWIGNFSIRYYGIFFALGFFVAVVIGMLKLRFFYKVYYEPFFYFVFIAVIVVLLGARLWSYVIGDAKDWSSFFALRTGGLAVEGGVIFCSIVALVWFSFMTNLPKYRVRIVDQLGVASIKKVSLWVYADAIVPLILLGQAIGRWGNFFNHEVHGAIVGTTCSQIDAHLFGRSELINVTYYDPGNSYLWLKHVMPGVYNMMFIYTPEDNVLAFRVPLFLIESFFNVIFFALIYGFVDQIKGYRCGVNSGLYFFYYGSIRAYLETLRVSPYKYSFSIVTSICFSLFGLGLILFTLFLAPKWRKRRMWFMLYVYMIYFIKRFLYMYVPSKQYTQSSINSKKEKLTWSKRKYIFLSKKQNFGLNVRPQFIRTQAEIFYFYDAEQSGPLFQWMAKAFKVFRREKVTNN